MNIERLSDTKMFLSKWKKNRYISWKQTASWWLMFTLINSTLYSQVKKLTWKIKMHKQDAWYNLRHLCYLPNHFVILIYMKLSWNKIGIDQINDFTIFCNIELIATVCSVCRVHGPYNKKYISTSDIYASTI